MIKGKTAVNHAKKNYKLKTYTINKHNNRLDKNLNNPLTLLP